MEIMKLKIKLLSIFLKSFKLIAKLTFEFSNLGIEKVIKCKRCKSQKNSHSFQS